MTVRRATTIVVVLAIGAVLLLVLRPGTAEHSAANAPRSETPDLRSAVITATEFLQSVDLNVLLDDDRRNRVLARFAAPAALGTLKRMYAAEKRRVSASYREPPRLARAALVGFRVDELTDREASVAIWAATIGGSGSFAPADGWSTTTVELSWETDRWRVTGVSDESGPSAEWPLEALVREAQSFEEYRHAP